MSLAIITMVRDEADRYLRSALSAWGQIADEIIALDDGSADGSVALLEAAGATTVPWDGSAWGQEAHARQRLFQAATEASAEWLLWLDADMVPANDPRAFMFDGGHDSLAFTLYDLWDAEPPRYRCDGMWQAHTLHRVWAVRNPRGRFVPHWNPRGLHCGHLPVNLKLERTLCLPPEYGLLHYAYAREEDRRWKHSRYMEQAGMLTEREIAHAASIVGPALTRRLEFLPALTLRYGV